LIRNVQIQGFQSQKKCEFTGVNDHFEDKHTAEAGLFLQAKQNSYVTLV
jgi:hypothetical protein